MRLVEEVINQGSVKLDGFAVNFDIRCFFINNKTNCCDSSIDHYLASGDHLLGMTTTSDTGMGKIFVNSHGHKVYCTRYDLELVFDEHHEDNTQDKARDHTDGLFGGSLLLELGYKVGRGDVDKTSRGDWN